MLYNHNTVVQSWLNIHMPSYDQGLTHHSRNKNYYMNERGVLQLCAYSENLPVQLRFCN